jgi:phosphotriesterase-related protein
MLGSRSIDEVGMILPHEHIFVDVRSPEKVADVTVDAADVIALMAPEIDKARAVGVTALVECSPVGVGRRVDLVRAVSEATDFPIVVPTGIYREPWIPAWAHAVSEARLRDWMVPELQGEKQ